MFGRMTTNWTEDDLRRRLHPLGTTAFLVQASIVITAHEVLKESVVGPVRDFLADSWTQEGADESDEYRREVKARHPNPVEASLLWLVDNHAIGSADADAMRILRKERNRLAHELGRSLVDPASTVEATVIDGAVQLARSLSRFWGEIEVQTNPWFADGEDVDLDDIRSGTALLLEHLQSVFHGSASLPDAVDLDLS